MEAYLGGKCIVLGPGSAGTMLLSHSVVFFLLFGGPYMNININEISKGSNMKSITSQTK